jgi:ABC-type multidrug transport system fused ATPase/permease subunit
VKGFNFIAYLVLILVAIARALYKNPEILIFDEATSSLDGTSQKNIWKAVKAFQNQNKTIIISTHRLQSITKADTIVVLKNGKLIEKGTHQELLAQKAEYHSLWKNQTGMSESF